MKDYQAREAYWVLRALLGQEGGNPKPYLRMMAVPEVVPLSLPMVSFTATGFVAPLRSAPETATWNPKRLLPRGAISTSIQTLLSLPAKAYMSAGPLRNKPAGIVVVKLAILNVTGSVAGLMPSLPCPKVKLDSRNKVL